MIKENFQQNRDKEVTSVKFASVEKGLKIILNETG
jgi:hypothetical protein